MFGILVISFFCVSTGVDICLYVLLVDLILLFLEASFKLLVSVLVPSPIVVNPSPNVADPAANWLDPELIFNAPSAN